MDSTRCSAERSAWPSRGGRVGSVGCSDTSPAGSAWCSAWRVRARVAGKIEKEYEMDFGVTFQTDPPAWRVVRLTQRAERLGFTHAWTFDSHILWQEPYVIYSQMLSATEKILVGPFVTNPASRDPSVTASLFATLNDMFGNRTICGIGRGDSAVRVPGRRPTTPVTAEEGMDTIKEM